MSASGVANEESSAYHHSAGKTITDESLFEYQDASSFVIEKILGIKLAEAMDAALLEARKPRLADPALARALSEPEVDTRAKKREDNESAKDDLEDASPEHDVETRAGLERGVLRKSKILAFKDGTPQLLQPGKFASISDAVLVLIYAIEHGLKKRGIPFDDFKGVFDLQNVKSGSPLTMILNNARRSSYLDDKAYVSDRTVRLSAKGEQKASETLRDVIST